jgi:hypothetical protein
MYPRTEYEMSEKDLKKILSACKPTPVIFGNGGMNLGGSQQENANMAWAELGKKMGFDYMTVRPIQGKNNRFFTAIPSETESQKEEREAKEKEEKRLQRIDEIKKEIATREQELKGLEK